jgi:hypothetical protein
MRPEHHNTPRDRTNFEPKSKPIRRFKTDLDDLVAKYIMSALVCYPQLIEEYEEKMLDFAVKDEGLRQLYDAMLEIAREDDTLQDETKLLQALDARNLGNTARQQLDLKVLKKQNPDIVKMRHNLDERLIEVQLRQLEADIRECKTKFESATVSDDEFRRFEALKKERDALLQEIEDL